MRRGTTPQNIFETDTDLSGATVYVTYQQGGKTVLEKTNDSLEIDGSRITVRLTQSETLAFAAGSVSIQLRYKLADGTADASEILTVPVKAILKDGEI